jgi:4'-phosphopantetheinyl transferase
MTQWPEPWQCALPANLSLSKGVVVVWGIDIDGLTYDPKSASYLSLLEQHRAARLTNPLLRERFLKTRAVLRQLLSGYAHIPEKDVLYEYGEHGKPVLADYPGIHFNLSHSESWALIALSVDGPVGVDVQCHRAVDYHALAKRFFSPKTYGFFNEIPTCDHEKYFFQYWCAYEAILKSQGLGIAHLSEYDIRIEGDVLHWSHVDAHVHSGNTTSLLLPMMSAVSAALIVLQQAVSLQLNILI